MPAHVIVVSQLPPPIHGSSRMTKEFLDSLTRVGVQYCLVDRRFSRTIDEIGRFSFRKVGAGVILIARSMISLIVWRHSPLILFATNRGFSLYCDAIIARFARLIRRHRVSYIHSAGWKERAKDSKLAAWAVDELTRRVNIAAALSPRLGAEFDAKVVILPNCASAVANIGRAADKDIDLLFLGNLIPEKGAGDAIRVCGTLRNKHALRVNLFVAGPAPSESDLEHLRGVARENNVSDAVTFVGRVDDRERNQILKRTRIMLFPSTYRFEAQPLVLLEAMSAGVPVVAYGVGGIPDVISDNEGICVTPNDMNGLTEAVIEILGSGDDYSRGAMETWANRYSRQMYDLNVQNLLKELEKA